MSVRSTRGEIISFYSYKGGTGRTMALANVACLLAEQIDSAESVLVVDWDLEAPGLHRFFPSRLSPPLTMDLGLDSGPGLIDLFIDIEKELPSSTATSDESAEALVNRALARVNVSSVISDTAVPKVKMLRAGRNDDGLYSSRVSRFNWEDLFRRAPTIYQAVGEHLALMHRYVLIDSRTGVTDISGICTSLLPEKLVVVFTPNRQSLTGVHELVEKATSYRKNSDDLRPLMVYPLPSRIESSLEDLRAKWRLGDRDLGIVGYQPMFESLFTQVYGLPACDLSAYFTDVQIQQTPDYAYGEEIAVRRTSDRFSLASSYRVFTERLVSGAPPWAQPVLEPSVAPAVEAPITMPPPPGRPASVPSTVKPSGSKPAKAPRADSTPAGSGRESPKILPPIISPKFKENREQWSTRPRVFLSYASADRHEAEQLAESLEPRGFEVWRNESLRAGTDFSTAIAQALDASEVIIVLWSRASISSSWVLREAEEGLRRGVLLPVLLEDVSPPLGFRQIQSLDLRRDRERGLMLLHEAITRIARASPGEATLPEVSASMRPSAYRSWRMPVAATLALLIAAVLAVAYLSMRRTQGPADAIGDASVRVPNFVGAQTADVQRTAALLKLQLVMVDKTGKIFDSLSGVVTGQSPTADEAIRRGGTVRLTVDAAVVTVPTLAGTSLDQALAALGNVGLALGTTETRIVTDAPDGSIVTQSPGPATSVPLGSKVNVTVARHPVASVVPEQRATPPSPRNR